MSDPSFLAGQTLPADDVQRLGEDDVWTPALTASGGGLDLGAGATLTGTVHYNGRLVTVQFSIVAGSSGVNPGSGTYQLDLPVGLTLDAAWAGNVAVGQAELNDSGTAVPLFIRTSTGTRLIFRHAGHATHGDAAWSASTVAIGTNDAVRGSFQAALA